MNPMQSPNTGPGGADFGKRDDRPAAARPARKLTFDEALEAINDQRAITRDQIQARALRRTVWVAEWHLPGCLSESSSTVTTKRDAIECALSMAEGPDGPPRGMRAELERSGWSNRTPPNAWAKGAITTVAKFWLSDLF